MKRKGHLANKYAKMHHGNQINLKYRHCDYNAREICDQKVEFPRKNWSSHLAGKERMKGKSAFVGKEPQGIVHDRGIVWNHFEMGVRSLDLLTWLST